MKTMLSLLAAGLAFAGSPAAALELVTNGNFEGGLSGWTGTGNVNAAFVPYFGLNSGQYGTQLAVFNAGDSTPNGRLDQAFGTVAGRTYNFSFDYGVTSNGNQSLVASILDADTLAVLGTQTVFTNSTAPTTAGFSFTALSNATLVRFDDVATNPTISQDIGFDNVSVSTVVPEPASWALMLGGFGAVGFARRRRAKVRFA